MVRLAGRRRRLLVRDPHRSCGEDDTGGAVADVDRLDARSFVVGSMRETVPLVPVRDPDRAGSDGDAARVPADVDRGRRPSWSRDRSGRLRRPSCRRPTQPLRRLRSRSAHDPRGSWRRRRRTRRCGRRCSRNCRSPRGHRGQRRSPSARGRSRSPAWPASCPGRGGRAEASRGSHPRSTRRRRRSPRLRPSPAQR